MTGNAFKGWIKVKSITSDEIGSMVSPNFTYELRQIRRHFITFDLESATFRLQNRVFEVPKSIKFTGVRGKFLRAWQDQQGDYKECCTRRVSLWYRQTSMCCFESRMILCSWRRPRGTSSASRRWLRRQRPFKWACKYWDDWMEIICTLYVK